MISVASYTPAEIAGAMTEINAQIACVKREIAMRERVYPKWIDAGRMKPEMAAREIDTMRGVLGTLWGAKSILMEKTGT